MRIAVDVDMTIADSDTPALQQVSKDLGVKPVPLRGDEYDLSKVFGDREDEARKLLDKYFLREVGHHIYANAIPIQGARGALRTLVSQGVEVAAYITRRPRHALGVTERWLRSFGFPIRTVIHAQRGVPKTHLVRAVGADIMIEDSPGEARLLHLGVGVILIGQPYNRRLPQLTNPQAVIRVDGWESVTKELLEQLARHPVAGD